MTQVLVHEYRVLAEALGRRVRAVLARRDTDEARALAAQAVPVAHETVRLVLTGQFSSGKSSLIKALTDGAAEPLIDADVATDEITQYDWDGAVTLVDTPGVQSGLREHDELALAAVGDSDLILFVGTINMFDDAAREFLRTIVRDGRRVDQTLVVFTHAGTAEVADSILADEVRSALGLEQDRLRFVAVDSEDYMESLEPGPYSDDLREASGIDRLRSEINALSENKGDLARARQPLQLARDIAQQAIELYLDEPIDRDALQTVNAELAAVTERRRVIDVAIDRERRTFMDACLNDVVHFVDGRLAGEDGASSQEELAAASERVARKLDAHATQWVEAMRNILEDELARLGNHLAEISERPHAVALLSELDELAPPVANAPAISSWRGRAHPRAGRVTGKAWAGLVQEQLAVVRNAFPPGDGVRGIRGAAGGAGHGLVLDLGHAFGAKFKPWQAVRIAAYVGKAAAVLDALGPGVIAGIELVQQNRAQREEVRRYERERSALITEVMCEADRIASDVKARTKGVLDANFRDLLSGLESASQAIIDAGLARDADVRELNSIIREANELLDVETTLVQQQGA